MNRSVKTGEAEPVCFGSEQRCAAMTDRPLGLLLEALGGVAAITWFILRGN